MLRGRSGIHFHDHFVDGPDRGLCAACHLATSLMSKYQDKGWEPDDVTGNPAIPLPSPNCHPARRRVCQGRRLPRQ